MSRSILFASILALFALLCSVSATLSQGALELTRDYGIEVSYLAWKTQLQGGRRARSLEFD